MPTAVHTTLKPGSIFLHDYRTTASRSPPLDRPLRIVQWNIERGYELAKIIQILKEVNADVLALQEIDIGCERSQKADVGEPFKLSAAPCLPQKSQYYCKHTHTFERVL